MTDEQTTDLVKAETDLAAAQAMPALASPMSVADGLALRPVDEQRIILAEYDARRDHFLRWLLSHLKEGVHYGFPPGCGLKLDGDGNLLIWSKKQNAYVAVPRTQWQAKPSLYKAGALLVVDLLKFGVVYETDTAAWEQLGAVKGTFVLRCILSDRASGKQLGEGRGIYAAGQKAMTANAAIKMAEKCALVDACINTVPVLGDLFTQDRERKAEPKSHAEAGVDPYKAPEPEPDDGETVDPDIAKAVISLHNTFRQNMPGVNWRQWCIDETAGELIPSDKDSWTMPIVEHLGKVLDAQIARDKGLDV